MVDTQEQKKQWYVVHTLTQREEQVRVGLERLINSSEDLKKKFGTILIPKETVIDARTRKPRQRSFFPGYVLVEMFLDSDTYWAVRNTQGVTGFLGGVRPSPISQEEAEHLVVLTEEGRKAKPRPSVTFVRGDAIRIIDGPFTNFMGTVEEINEQKSRLKATVVVFGRGTPVELDFLQVEKV